MKGHLLQPGPLAQRAGLWSCYEVRFILKVFPDILRDTLLKLHATAETVVADTVAMVSALFAFSNYTNIRCYKKWAGEDISEYRRNKMMGTCLLVTVLSVLCRIRKYMNNNRNHTEEESLGKGSLQGEKGWGFLFICTGSAYLLLEVVFSDEEVEEEIHLFFSWHSRIHNLITENNIPSALKK